MLMYSDGKSPATSRSTFDRKAYVSSLKGLKVNAPKRGTLPPENSG